MNLYCEAEYYSLGRSSTAAVVNSAIPHLQKKKPPRDRGEDPPPLSRESRREHSFLTSSSPASRRTRVRRLRRERRPLVIGERDRGHEGRWSHQGQRRRRRRRGADADAAAAPRGAPLLLPLLPRRLLRLPPLHPGSAGGGGSGPAGAEGAAVGGGVARDGIRRVWRGRAVIDPVPGNQHNSDALEQILSWQPRALYFPQFATSEQCENVVRIANERLAPSTLALRKGETKESTKGIRTSSGTFLTADEDPSGTLAEVEKKIARATMLPRNHGEPFNVLRYEIGQKYASHYDAFDPAQYGPQKSQRVASFLLYLTDIEEGGETMFPYENGENMDLSYDYEKCIGLKVKPRKGDGLLFYSLMVNGTIDPTSLHGSCPVIKGEKWVATKWIRDNKL